MSGFILEQALARESLSKLIDDISIQLELHYASRPSYPVEAAGREFEAHGAALASMFEAIHGTVGERIHHVLSTTEAARDEIDRFTSEDRGFASGLFGAF